VGGVTRPRQLSEHDAADDQGSGFVASLLFTIVAVQMFLGRPLTPLSEPLPFFAYPFLALTLFGWAWVHSRPAAT
jgi:hypothetical protein